MNQGRIAMALQFWKRLALAVFLGAALLQLYLWMAGAPVSEFR